MIGTHLRFPARRAVDGIAALERFYSMAKSGAVPMEDFTKLHSMALESLRRIAAIAREYPLTDEQEEAVSGAVRRIEGFTASMSPEDESPPWWLWGLVALGGAGVGALVVDALSPSSGKRPSQAMSGAGYGAGGHVGKGEAAMLAISVVSSFLGFLGWKHRDTAVGTMTMGAAASAAGVSLTMLVRDLAGAES